MTVAALCEKHNVELVAIGNGTASRETERFYLDVQKQFPKVTAQKVIVSEAGASVYSASELAAQEFPDLDVSGIGRHQFASGIDHRHFYPGTQTRIEAHRCTQSGRGRHQQIVQVTGKDVDCFIFRAFAHGTHQFGFQMHQHLDAPGPAHYAFAPAIRRGIVQAQAKVIHDDLLAIALFGRLIELRIGIQRKLEYAFVTPTEHRQRAVRRHRGQRFVMIEIVAEFRPFLFFDLLWSDPSHTPEVAAAQYVDADKGVADTKAALDGARYILMERFAEDAALLAKVRDYLWKNAHLVSTVVSGKEEEGAKFRDYFDHHEPLSTVPSHRSRSANGSSPASMAICPRVRRLGL